MSIKGGALLSAERLRVTLNVVGLLGGIVMVAVKAFRNGNEDVRNQGFAMRCDAIENVIK